MVRFDRAGDAIRLALSGAVSTPAVRRDAQGVPTAFRVFAPGLVTLTLAGRTVSGQFTAEDTRAILAYHQAKGSAIPIDCEHLLARLADAAGKDEAELVAATPLLGERAAAGMATLADEHGELWAHVTRWADRARVLLAGTADAVYQYFSPVLRGLEKGPLRMTSIALTNCPALNGLDTLSATDATGDFRAPLARFQAANAEEGTKNMDALKKLIALLGLDEAKLTAEKADLAELFARAAAEVEAARAAAGKFTAGLKDALALTDADTPDTIVGKILALAEKQKADAAALTDAQAKLATAAAADKARMIADLKAQGKLTEALLPWAEKQDVAALTEWAKAAPVIVPPNRITSPATLAAGDAARMTDADRKVAAMCGFTAEEYAKANKLAV